MPQAERAEHDVFNDALLTAMMDLRLARSHLPANVAGNTQKPPVLRRGSYLPLKQRARLGEQPLHRTGLSARQPL